MGGPYQVLEVGVSPVLVFRWLELSHMTPPNCRGNWEMWSRCVSRQRQKARILVDCQESKVMECVGLFIYMANRNDPCPTVSSRKERVGISTRKETALEFSQLKYLAPSTRCRRGEVRGSYCSPGTFLRRSQQVPLGLQRPRAPLRSWERDRHPPGCLRTCAVLPRGFGDLPAQALVSHDPSEAQEPSVPYVLTHRHQASR